MNNPYPICRDENRVNDGFDLITILGLMKEYNLRVIWRRYLANDSQTPSISMYVEAENYFIEMHLQKMRRIILSEKFNTNPFFMQQVVQRLIASHPHGLIIEKIQQQGIDTGDDPISLACSMGSTIIDLIANKTQPFDQEITNAQGNTLVEREEKHSIDVYDLSSTLYLCQQNLTETIFRRYRDLEVGEKDLSRVEVHLETLVDKYLVILEFHRVSPRESTAIPPHRNTSVQTIHQVLQRMNFLHSPRLIQKELRDAGLSISLEQATKEFSLRRYMNNTSLKLDFSNLS